MTPYREIVTDSAKELAVFNLLSIPIAFVGGVYYSVSPLDAFGLVMLLEATVLMLVGGAMDLANSSSAVGLAKIFRRKEASPSFGRGSSGQGLQGNSKLTRAAVFTLTGVLLFLEAVLLSLPFLR